MSGAGFETVWQGRETVTRALRFTCEGHALAGILDLPRVAGRSPDCGVVVVVGGPQTRLGSHRQFALLARDLAAAGYPTLRFDLRGMGDSEGEAPGFEAITPDIAAAVDALQRECPELRRVVLWGLCDAASAIMMYAWRDERIVGTVLLNPWVRTDRTQARTLVRHYYLQRLREPSFWGGLLGGRVGLLRALRGFFGNLLRSLGGSRGGGGGRGTPDDPALAYPERMRRGMQRYPGPVLLVLSGNDLTAAEFRDLVREHPEWRELVASARWSQRDLPEATHTFSSAAWRNQVAAWTRDWLDRLAP